MKKYLFILLPLLILIFAVSYINKETAQPENTNSNTQNSAAKETALPENVNPKTQNNPAKEAKSIDIDLTIMSSTMVYAEIFNIIRNPNAYKGKVIKMSGPYDVSYYEKDKSYNHFVIIEDETACCREGLQFVWNGEHIYPDDYPEQNEKIEVIGKIGINTDNGRTYFYLAVDNLSVLKL